MSRQSATRPQRTSERFNAPDADVVIQSSDGVQFSLHRAHLAIATGAFPPMEIETGGEIVSLTEDAATLELLFQFVYPQRHPSLADAPYRFVAPLAEAAEKYEVFAAMNICQIRMANFLPSHAKGIMAYAAKHGYRGIVDKAVPLVVSLPTKEVISLLPQHLVIPWLTYRQQLYDILLDAIKSQPTVSQGSYGSVFVSQRSGFDLDLDPDLTLSSLFSLSSSSVGRQAGRQRPYDIQVEDTRAAWLTRIKTQFDSVPKFSSYL